MIDPDKEELVEGGKYLQAFDNTFNPDDKKLRYRYTFELIVNALEAFQLIHYLDQILEILVFDALIGNSDRHQENWALITEHSTLSKSIATIEYDLRHENLEKTPRWLKWIIQKTYLKAGSQEIKPELKKMKLLMAKNTKFAPIYDSGCSFGRELTEQRVEEMLKSEESIQTYINKGKSEIHWNDSKISHFDLVKHLLAEGNYVRTIKNSIERIHDRINDNWVYELIQSIDVGLDSNYSDLKISEGRKRLICKLIISRANRLKELI